MISVALLYACLKPLLAAIERPRTLGTDLDISADDAHVAFDQLVRAETSSRLRARERFPGHAWSQQDDEAQFMRGHARRIGQSMGLTLSQVYLVMDRGLRERWVDDKGRRLKTRVVPLNPRIR